MMILPGVLLACVLAEPTIKEQLAADLAALPVHRSARGGEEHIKGLQQTEDLLSARLKELGFTPTLQEVRWALPHQPDKNPEPPHTWHNIIVEKAGSEGKKVLIIGAHFDAVTVSPGADDNGSGVAALLHVARTIKAGHYKHSIRLVFFTCEEVGLVGAQRYAAEVAPQFAAHPDATNKDTPAEHELIGMVSLESIGYYSDAPDSQRSPIAPIKDVFEPPTVGNFLALTGVAAHQKFSRSLTKAMTTAQPSLRIFAADFFPLPIPDIMRSDHAPFLLRGMPAVMLTDTANFRNANYHTATDEIKTLDMDRLAIAAQAVAAATETLAEKVEK